ncbi:RNA polymerase sigma factor [Maribacter sp. 2304DJ31-5]|uniref:RNA polymerase sigma factor n=1 Tax=Maribacter sp. 2304DJ31-5 TaxID=3386273 RepID=UPI0039BD11E3
MENYKENDKLIRGLKKGKERAYLFLIDRYHVKLHAYAVSLINDHVMAQDIVQNVFLKTWQFRENLDDKYSIQSFLYKSVYNEFINKYRQKQAMLDLECHYAEALQQMTGQSNEQELDQVIAMVKEEVQNLPPKCQHIFLLSKKDGLTNNEIADYLGISIKTVETQITKAYKVLRRKLHHKIKMILLLVLGNRLGEKSFKCS